VNPTPAENVLTLRSWNVYAFRQSVEALFLLEGVVRGEEQTHFSLHTTPNPEQLILKVNGVEVETFDFNTWELLLSADGTEITLLATKGHVATANQANLFAYCYKFRAR